MKHWSTPTITVRFFEEGQPTPFVESDIPLDRLPETFEAHTDLDISGTQYVVVRAEPETKAAFSQMNRLDITVRKVETMRPQDILFSIPTLCGAALPPSATARPDGEVLALHEDDWRQCEFVAMDHAQLIAQELAAIHRIHDGEKVGAGFRNIHVRSAIATPLPLGLAWSTVTRHLGETTSLAGVTIMNQPIANASAARLADGVVVWGIGDDSGLSALCVHDVRSATATSADALRRVADALNLALVDWCPCRAYVPGDAVLDDVVGLPWA
jgi:hypothetical protein